jgi:hypothetical protein
MKLNEHKRDHLDKEAFALVELMTVSEIPTKPKPPDKKVGSLGEQQPVVTLNFVTDMVETHGNKRSQVAGDKKIGFDEETGKRFQKFVSTIHNDRDIKQIISRKFIETKSWKWIFKTRSEAKAESNFSSYILSEMENAIETHKFHFHIVYLNIQTPFKIGNVEFGYFTSEYFDKYLEAFAQNQPDKENPYIWMKKHYKGNVYAATIISAEHGQGEDIALEICSLSMDVLKVCSNTLDFPNAPIHFDIDRRSRINPQSEVVVESRDFVKGLHTNLSRPAFPYSLDNMQFEHVKKRRLESFHNFISGLTNDQSELDKLIIQGIKRLADALTNTNYYQRVAELFTILESLLLLSEDSPIIDTVSKYASKLITKDKETRKTVIKLLKEMYKVRSNWVHHAKEREFQITDLATLQKIVHALLLSLIAKTKTHKNKQELLEEIDDAILGAY